MAPIGYLAAVEEGEVIVTGNALVQLLNIGRREDILNVGASRALFCMRMMLKEDRSPGECEVAQQQYEGASSNKRSHGVDFKASKAVV